MTTDAHSLTTLDVDWTGAEVALLLLFQDTKKSRILLLEERILDFVYFVYFDSLVSVF